MAGQVQWVTLAANFPSEKEARTGQKKARKIPENNSNELGLPRPPASSLLLRVLPSTFVSPGVFVSFSLFSLFRFRPIPDRQFLPTSPSLTQRRFFIPKSFLHRASTALPARRQCSPPAHNTFLSHFTTSIRVPGLSSTLLQPCCLVREHAAWLGRNCYLAAVDYSSVITTSSVSSAHSSVAFCPPWIPLPFDPISRAEVSRHPTCTNVALNCARPDRAAASQTTIPAIPRQPG